MHTHTTPGPALPPALGLILGVSAVSTASTFIRLAQGSLPSLTVAAWRLTLASLILAPFALATQRTTWRKLHRRDWLLILASGVILATHFFTWITSLALTTVAASVVLVTTTPIFVGVISHFFLGERMTRPMTIGILIAFLGSTIIGLGDLESGTHHLTGDFLALTGALAAACYMLIGRQLRPRLSLLGYVFPVYSVAALSLLTLALVSGTSLGVQPTTTWLWLAMMALIPQIVGHSSLNWALGHLSTTYVALAVLAEPIGSTLLAWWILDEPPTLVTVGGGLLILAGIATATLRRSKP